MPFLYGSSEPPNMYACFPKEEKSLLCKPPQTMRAWFERDAEMYRQRFRIQTAAADLFRSEKKR